MRQGASLPNSPRNKRFMTSASPHRPIAASPGHPVGRPGPGRAAAAAPAFGSGFTTSIDPIRVLRRHIWLLIAAGIGGTILGIGLFIYLNRAFPLYSGEVRFEVRPGLQSVDQLTASEMSREDVVSRLANTEISILLSRDVLSQAVNQSDIRNRTQWGRRFVLDSGGMDVERAVDDLEETLSASMIRGTNLFALRWSTRHAADIPEVLNRIHVAYIGARERLDIADFRHNIDLFERKLRNVDDQIGDLQTEITNFIREHGIQSSDGIRQNTRTDAALRNSEEIAKVSNSLSMTRVALRQIEAKMAGVLEPDSKDRLTAEMDQVIRQQDQLLSELKSRLRQAREIYVKADDRMILTIERQIRSRELEREAKLQEIIQRNLEAMHKEHHDTIEQYESLLQELEAVQQEHEAYLKELSAATADYQALEMRRSRLEAERDDYRTRLEHIHQLRERADASRVRVAMGAQLPRQKSFPQIHIIVPLVALLCVFLTLGVVFLRELTDQRIKSASDLAVVPSAKLLGLVPDLDEDPTSDRKQGAELIVQQHPLSVLAESYRQTCANLLPAIERGAHQTILFLSGLPGAGTTTAITNIACSLSATGKRVLVIDANFRRPRLAEVMAAPAGGPGLGDLLAEAATIDESIVQAECGVSVIPAGTPANRVFERLNNGNFESIVAELRGRFDLILFDAPPAVVAGDAMVLANRLDAAVLVVRANQEQKGLVARLVTQLGEARCEALGVLLNRPRGTAGGYFKKNFEAMAKYSRK